MSNDEFKVYHSELRRYATNLIKKNFYSYGNKTSIIDKDDLINEAIANCCFDLDSAKKIIRSYLISETFKEKANRQFNGVSNDYSKHCKMCGSIKPSSDFLIRTDYRTGLTYLNYLCNDCNKIRRKELYAKSETSKEKAKLRYLKWKQKHKKYEYAV